MKTLLRSHIPVAVAAGICAFISAGAEAEFNLNFTANNPNPEFSNNVISNQHGGNNLPGQTPFIYERVLDANNVPYYHMVVGDPATGFAQEVYVQVGGSNNAFQGGVGNIGPQGSASGGTGSADSTGLVGTGNAVDPLGTSTAAGNASGNPTRVEMRQINVDGDLNMEFLKGKFADKPSITSDITSTDFSAAFKMDSTGNGYSQSTTPSAVTNKLQVTDPTTGQQVVDFNAATDSQQPSVTAGRYTYTPGTGALNNLGSGGTYIYSEGTANVNPDWKSYFDQREANPWSYPANRP